VDGVAIGPVLAGPTRNHHYTFGEAAAERLAARSARRAAAVAHAVRGGTNARGG
jgi:hypothetical protein